MIPLRRPSSAALRTGAMASAIAMLVLLYLWPAAWGPLDAPAGFDTPKYIWRSELVSQEGLDALATLPPGVAAHPDRPLFPLVMGVLASTLPGGTYELAFVVPALFAALIGLTVGGLSTTLLREPRWSSPVYAVAIGSSAAVALTAVAHWDNLIWLLFVLGVATLAVPALDDRRAASGAALLLVAAIVAHWPLGMLFSLVLAIVAAFTLLQRSRDPASSRSDRSFGLMGAVLVSVPLAWLLIVWMPGSPAAPGLSEEAFAQKLDLYAPYHALWIVIPLAVVGIATLFASSDRLKRFAGLFCIVWAAPVVVAVVGLELGFAVPAHRVLASSVAIPLAATVAVVWGAQRIARRSPRFATGITAATVLAWTFGALAVGFVAWTSEANSIVDTAAYREARAADRYRESFAPDRPAVFVLSRTSLRPGTDLQIAERITRLAAGRGRVTNLAVYVGRPELLLSDRPRADLSDPGSRGDALRSWASVRSLMEDDPVVLALASMVDGFPSKLADLTEAPVADGVAVLRGPAPVAFESTGLDPPRPGPLSLVALTALALIVVIGIGLGWSDAIAPGSLGERIAIAPALGTAVLAFVALLCDRIGIRIEDAGIAIVLAAGALGWLPALAMRLRAREDWKPWSR